MAYSMFEQDKSDVYLYGGVKYLHCCSCRLFPNVPHEQTRAQYKEYKATWKKIGVEVKELYSKYTWEYGDMIFSYRSAALEHIKFHLKAGYKVHRGTMARLKREIVELGDKY